MAKELKIGDNIREGRAVWGVTEIKDGNVYVGMGSDFFFPLTHIRPETEEHTSDGQVWIYVPLRLR